MAAVAFRTLCAPGVFTRNSPRSAVRVRRLKTLCMPVAIGFAWLIIGLRTPAVSHFAPANGGQNRLHVFIVQTQNRRAVERALC